MDIAHLEDGMVVEEWTQADICGFLHPVGVLLDPLVGRGLASIFGGVGREDVRYGGERD